MDKDKSENLNATGPVADQSRISQKTGASHVSKYSGPNQESYCFTKRLNAVLKYQDDSLKSERLQAIHDEDIEQFKESIQEFKENQKNQKYIQEVILCFWYAIHCEQIQTAQYIYTLDGNVRALMKNFRENPTTKFELEVYRRKQQDIKKKALVQIENEDEESNQINSSQKQDSDDEMDSSQRKNDGSGQKNDFQIDSYNIQGNKDLKETKYILTKVNCKSGAPFNTNVLRIALNLKEEYLASLILEKKYQISMDEKIIIRAIKSDQFDFLFWMFARNQNFEELEQNKQLNNIESKSHTQQDSSSQFSQDSPQYKVFTYEYLFQQIKVFKESTADEICLKIGEWEQISSENIIESMLKNKLDLVAIHTGKLELKKEYCNSNVFEYALENSNEVFLKQSFKNPDSIFQASILERKEIKTKIFEMLEEGKNILLMLNVLIYAEFDKWTEKEQYLTKLFEILSEMCEADVEPNMSYMCYNPILMICLSCEALKKIGEAYSILKQECSEVSEELLKLGGMLLEEMDKEVVNVLYMDVDFLDRTTLKLISENEYETLILNFKVDALLDQLWSGKSNECNGYVSDYSLLTYLASAPIRKLPGQMIEFDSLTFNNFKDQIEKETFPIQFDYRMNSINEIFNKELLFTIFICTVMIVINITYVQNFALSNYASFPNNIGLFQPYQCDKIDYWAQFNVTIPDEQLNICNPPTTDTSTDTSTDTNTDDNSTSTDDNSTSTTDSSSTTDNSTSTEDNNSNSNDNSTEFLDNNSSLTDNTNNSENENDDQNNDSSSDQNPSNNFRILLNQIFHENISANYITQNLSMLVNQSQSQNFHNYPVMNTTNQKKRNLQDSNTSETDSQPGNSNSSQTDSQPEDSNSSETDQQPEDSNSSDIDLQPYNTNPFLYGYFTDEFLNDLASQDIYFDNFTLSDGQLYIVNNYSDIQVQMDYWQQQQYEFTQQQINDYDMWNNIGLIISVSLIFYVTQKLIFNLYAVIPLSMDKWSLIDIGCSIVNLVSFMYIKTIDYDAINDQNKKIYYNTFMVLVIFATWTRFTGIGMIINTFCVLIVSILASIAVTANFCIATTLYHIMMMFFRYINFQGMVYGYDNFFVCFRAVLFEFDWGGNNLYTIYYQNDYYYYYNVLAMFIHLTVNKIIIQNYLVAVVSGVYEENAEIGEVKYKSNKYQYIERYYLAQQNQYGYQELISHPPPFNLLLVFLLPSVFNQDKMKKNSVIFSKIVFWIENICFYIPKEFMQELILMPYIYGRTLFYTIKFADRLFCIYQILGWAFLGPFFLMYGICFDMCNFIKVLMIVKKREDEDNQEEINNSEMNNDGQKLQKKQSINQEEQSQLQKKIQIYNEIIQVIKFILFVFFNERKIRVQKKQNDEQEDKSIDGLDKISEEEQKEKKKKVKNVITLDQALKIENNEEEGSQNEDKKQEENKEQEEEEEIKEGYSLQKSIICEAWARYREDQKKNSNQAQQIKTEYGFDKKMFPPEQEYKFDEEEYQINFSLFSQSFIDYVLSNINLKIYEYTESEIQKNRKKKFKKDFSKYYQGKMLEEQIMKKQDLDAYQEKLQGKDENLDNKKLQEKLEQRKQQQNRQKFEEIEKEEKNIIVDLLKCFIQQSDDATLVEQIDLSLTLKALPSKVDEQNVKRCELFNFEHTASSLIAFECEDQDLLFKYYDTRNKTRLNKLNKKATNTEKLTSQLIENSKEVFNILKEIKHQGKISDYHSKILQTND